LVTPQEITNFINQPTPRKIPKNILRAVNYKNKHLRYLAGFLVIYALMLSLILLFLQKDILLDILSNRVQGVLIGWKRYEVQEINISCYQLVVRYPTPKGEEISDCYVDFKENIPGWGQIPESLSYQDSDDSVFLSTPFPVIVEYVKLFPSVARAVGTKGKRSSQSADAFIMFLPLLIISLLLFTDSKPLKKDKQLLTKGCFTTGHVSEPKKHLLSVIVFVWFNDQLGKRQTGIYTVRTKRDEAKCRQLFADDRPVGLMYLPDRLDIIITDLLLADDLKEARGRS